MANKKKKDKQKRKKLSTYEILSLIIEAVGVLATLIALLKD